MLPRHQQRDVTPQEQAEEEVASDEGVAMPPLRPSSPWPAAQLSPYITRLCSGDTHAVLQTLEDLDETSKRKVEVIQYFLVSFEVIQYFLVSFGVIQYFLVSVKVIGHRLWLQSDLKRLMQSSHEACRNLAFVLVMRHIRQNPRSAQPPPPTLSPSLRYCTVPHCVVI